MRYAFSYVKEGEERIVVEEKDRDVCLKCNVGALFICFLWFRKSHLLVRFINNVALLYTSRMMVVKTLFRFKTSSLASNV